MADTTLTRVQNLIVEQLGIEASKVTPNSRLMEDLDLDSLDSLELVMALEEEFDVEVPDDKRVDDTTTVQALADYVDQLVQENA